MRMLIPHHEGVAQVAYHSVLYRPNVITCISINSLLTDNWPGIAPAFFFEGGLAGLSGAEPESGKTPPSRSSFHRILTKKKFRKKLTKKIT